MVLIIGITGASGVIYGIRLLEVLSKIHGIETILVVSKHAETIVRYETGYEINGLDKLDSGVIVFHAGTRPDAGRVLTSGGRVLAVVASGSSIADARNKVYGNIGRVSFDGAVYRSDIALREVT